jgi:hypothetical protein
LVAANDATLAAVTTLQNIILYIEPARKLSVHPMNGDGITKANRKSHAVNMCKGTLKYYIFAPPEIFLIQSLCGGPSQIFSW